MNKFFFKDREFFLLDSVYKPSDDSFLLANSVVVMPNVSVLDLGCGTGIQGLGCALQGASSICFADKNHAALNNAKLNIELLKKSGLKVKTDFAESDLFSRLKKKFDVIVFNPPYVPSKEKKFVDLDGGKKGREVLDSFLEQFPRFLNKKGRVFFLQTSINGIIPTKNILKKKGLESRIVAKKKLFFEELIVFEAWKK